MAEATIRTIKTVESVAGADFIEQATLEGLGWKFVVKKGEFLPGDRCAFFCIDALLPKDAPWAKFLADKGDEFLRIRTARLRGALSQGLALPVRDVFPDGSMDGVPDGTDVTDAAGVIHWEKPIPEEMRGNAKGNMPGYLPRTQEVMLQNVPDILEALRGREIVSTVKCNGFSTTFGLWKGTLDVCGRRWSMNETPDDPCWRLFRKYRIDKALSDGLAIQGEVVGPGIHGNKMHLPEVDLRVFDIWDIEKAAWWGHRELVSFCADNGLPMVPVDEVAVMDGERLDPAWWIAKAEGLYAGTQSRREGIVVRSLDPGWIPGLRCRASFKVLNNVFLAKDER